MLDGSDPPDDHPLREGRHGGGHRTGGREDAPTQGCSGRVTISAKRGTKTVAIHRTTINRNCELKTTLKFRSRIASKLKLVPRFEGNDVLGPRTAWSRTIRLG